MNFEQSNEIIRTLRRAGLYKGNYTRIPCIENLDGINRINNLLYWKKLIMFDFKENPLQHDSWGQNGTELNRTISLKINMGKFTKRFGNYEVIIPPHHIDLLRGEPPEIKDYNEEVVSESEIDNWILKKTVKTYTVATPKEITLPPTLPLKEVFKHYVESNLSLTPLKHLQQEHPERYKYEMKIPNTDYLIKFFITGSIYSISVVKEEVQISDILKMNHWASIELKNIVEKSTLCRKLQVNCEPDFEPENEITYVCNI